MNFLKKLFLGVAGLAFVGAAQAQVTAPVIPPQPPQVQQIGPTDLFQDVVNGFAQAQSYYASSPMMAGFMGNAGAQLGDNFIIGGDFGTNLMQRVSVANATITMGTGATVVYGADRWAGWEAVAGSTAFTVSQVTTAASLPTGVKDSLLMKLTNSQTGTAQICIAQEIASANAYYLAGHTVEADFNVYTGATFTAAAVNAYIIYGTDAAGDNGTNNLAFGLNANSVSSTAWAGQTNATTGALATPAVSTMYRGMAVAAIPSTATEVALALCWTPNGTSSGTGGTDGVYWSNVELRKADYLANWANATTAYTINNTSGNVQATINGATQTFTMPPFAHRDRGVEAFLQYQYYYLIPEVDTAGAVQGPLGEYDTTTTCSIAFPLPAPMRAVPTLGGLTAIGAYNALSATTFKIAPDSVTPVVLATTFGKMQVGASTTTSGVVSFITTAETQYIPCSLNSTAAGAGAFAFNAEL